MATISITNQTLTISLIVDGATTVIRKDNCKVQAFGDVVRITDYTGTIYEFLYTDCESPSEASGADLRDAIEAFLNTAGGGGSGLSSIESSTLDVSIADGVATVDLPYTRSVFFFSVEEGSATLLSQINFLGGTISLTNTSAFVFTLTRTGGSALTGIALGGLYGTCQDAINGDPVIGVLGSGTLGIDESITFKKFDNTAISSDGVINCGIYIDYYPNGFDA
jgi:hypothetical protein